MMWLGIVLIPIRIRIRLSFLMLIKIRIRMTFHSDADPDSDPDPNPSFTHAGKSEIWFAILFIAVSASLHCFFFMDSAPHGYLLGQYRYGMKFSGEKYRYC
jgi:hypothetical protein